MTSVRKLISPSPSLRDALDERAEHVAVAERRVVVTSWTHGRPDSQTRDVLVERVAAAHRRQRLEQRVAVARGGRQPERPQDRRVAVAEAEVDDPPVAVANGPQDADQLGEAVQQGAELRRALGAEELDELRILPPRLEFGLHGRGAYAPQESQMGPKAGMPRCSKPWTRRSVAGLLLTTKTASASKSRYVWSAS